MFLLTVDLCDTSTTLHSDSDVNASKALLTQQQHWLQKLQGQNKAHSSTNVIAALNPNDGFFFHTGTDLVLEGGWLQHLQRFAINLQKAIPPLAVSNCCGGFLWQFQQLTIKSKHDLVKVRTIKR